MDVGQHICILHWLYVTVPTHTYIHYMCIHIYINNKRSF